MQAKPLILAFIGAFMLQSTSLALAEEKQGIQPTVVGASSQSDESSMVTTTGYKLPPAIQQCYDNAYSDSDIAACSTMEGEFWDKVLNQNYKKAMSGCKTFAQDNMSEEEQAQGIKKCQNDIKTAQRNWIKYRDAMSAVLCDYASNYGGTMQYLQCASGKTEIIREQALRLMQIYGVDD